MNLILNFNPFSLLIDDNLMNSNAELTKKVLNIFNHLSLNHALLSFENFFSNPDFVDLEFTLSLIQEQNLPSTNQFRKIKNHVYIESNYFEDQKIYKNISDPFLLLFTGFHTYAELSDFFEKINLNEYIKLINEDKKKRFSLYREIVTLFLKEDAQLYDTYLEFINYWENPISLPEPENIVYSINGSTVMAFQTNIQVFANQHTIMQEISDIALDHMQFYHAQRTLYIEEHFFNNKNTTHIFIPKDSIIPEFFYDSTNHILKQNASIIFRGNEAESIDFLNKNLQLSTENAIISFPRNCKYEDIYDKPFLSTDFLTKIYNLRTVKEEKEILNQCQSNTPAPLKRL